MRTFRYYSEPFVLDESKLGRIDRIIRDQFKTVSKKESIQYVVVLKSTKTFYLSSLDSLLSMDNSLNDPITTLHIVAETYVEDSPESPEKNGSSDNNKKYYYCDVHFTIQSAQAIIATSAQSPDITWSNSTLLALEEQIPRTFQRDFWSNYRHSHRAIPISIMLFFIFIIVITESVRTYQRQYDLSDRMWLTENEIAQLLSKTDEKFSPVEVYQFQLKNLRYYNQKGLSWKLLLSWKVDAILIPLIFVVFAFLYLLFRCYPMAVFNWGDMNEWYNNICRKRKVVWEFIAGAVILGLFVNIAASGIVGLLQ
jgi:hypothetical protein